LSDYVSEAWRYLPLSTFEPSVNGFHSTAVRCGWLVTRGGIPGTSGYIFLGTLFFKVICGILIEDRSVRGELCM